MCVWLARGRVVAAALERSRPRIGKQEAAPLEEASPFKMVASTFESGHADMVHDAQLDYYGRRLATCSSDRTVKVFEITGDQHSHLADLRGHEGPVWQVAWAHPKFGSLLASCSFDHRVIVWREGADNQWQQVRNRGAKGRVWNAEEAGVPPEIRGSDRQLPCAGVHQPRDAALGVDQQRGMGSPRAWPDPRGGVVGWDSVCDRVLVDERRMGERQGAHAATAMSGTC